MSTKRDQGKPHADTYDEPSLIPCEQVDGLARVYLDFDKAFNRTRSRAAIDGGVMLLAIVDELRRLRHVLESQGHER